MNNKIILWTFAFILLISCVFASDYQQIITETQDNVWSFGYNDDMELQAQSFNINDTGVYILDSVSSYMRDYGDVADNYIIRIETDTANHPSGTLVSANATMTIDGSGVTNSYQWFDDSFTNNVYLNAGVKYWIVWSRSGALSTSDWYAIGRNTARTDYPSHEAMVRGTDGTWDYFGGASQDLATSKFNYSDPVVIPPSANFSIIAYDSYNTTGLNTDVEVLYNGTTYSFNGTEIDTGLSDTSLLANITITSDGYDTVTVLNYNIGTNLEQSMNLTLGRIVFDSNVKAVSTGSTISGYTVTATSLTTDTEYSTATTNYDLIVFVPKSDSYEILVDGNTSYSNYLVNISYDTNVSFVMPNVYLYNQNSINITVYDEETLSVINDRTIDIDLISNVYANNYSTATGNIEIDVLSPSEYTIRYSAPEYSERYHFFTLVNNTHTDIDLYLLNSSSSELRTVTIVDQNSNTVEGAIVKAVKYDITTNSYIQVAESQTDINGQVFMNLTTTEYHKFIVEYDGETLKTTNPTYLSQSSYTIQIVIGNAINLDYLNFRTIDYTFGFTDSTNNFRLNYNDVSGFTSRLCVYVYTVTAQRELLFNSSCSASSSGTLLVGVSEINGTTYRGDVYYFESDGDSTFLSSAFKEFSGKPDLSNLGLFLQILLTIAVVAITIWSIPVLVIAVPASLIFGHMLALNSISIVALIGIQVVAVFIAAILQRRA